MSTLTCPECGANADFYVSQTSYASYTVSADGQAEADPNSGLLGPDYTVVCQECGEEIDGSTADAVIALVEAI